MLRNTWNRKWILHLDARMLETTDVARGGEPQAKISKIYRDSGSTVARSAINYRNITIYNNGAGGGEGR